MLSYDRLELVIANKPTLVEKVYFTVLQECGLLAHLLGYKISFIPDDGRFVLFLNDIPVCVDSPEAVYSQLISEARRFLPASTEDQKYELSV